MIGKSRKFVQGWCGKKQWYQGINAVLHTYGMQNSLFYFSTDILHLRRNRISGAAGQVYLLPANLSTQYHLERALMRVVITKIINKIIDKSESQ